MKKIFLIVNPLAGKKDRSPAAEKIKKLLSASLNCELFFWRHLQQKEEIMRRLTKEDFSITAAMGGDGTINQAAQALVNSPKTFAIIPAGSGNGLARHLGIPLDPIRAASVIISGKEKLIDSCTMNGIFFFCASGVGFDAHISRLFAQSRKRGFFTYLRLSVREFFKYKPGVYSLSSGEKKIKRKAFLITIANASQYGNNAYIAPGADIADGLMDVCILYPFRLWHAPILALRLFTGTIHRSPLFETFRTKHLVIERDEPGPVHYDGEYCEAGTILEYSILPSSLRVIVKR